MSRRLKIMLAVLAIAVVAGTLYFPGLHRRLLRLTQTQTSEEAARRELVQPPVATPSDAPVKARIFWASARTAGALEPAEVELRLSADPVQRAKQVIQELIARPPAPEQRTLPADAALLEFYLLPGGIAVADFSDTLATSTPSGILSEQMAVDSIARTLEANVPGLEQLKILIHGQESKTLAGHVDLTGYFALSPAPAPAGPATPPLTPLDAAGKLKKP